MDYNAAGYEDEHQKMAMISRLLPFVEKRVNLIELALKELESHICSEVSADTDICLLEK